MEQISLFTEEVIRRWFLDNRPDLNVDVYLIQDVYAQVKENIQDLDPIIVNTIKELIESSEDEDFIRTRQDWRGMGIYNMEVGSLTEMVIDREIPENNIVFGEEGMGYDMIEMKQEIYKVIEDYIKEDWS